MHLFIFYLFSLILLMHFKSFPLFCIQRNILKFIIFEAQNLIILKVGHWMLTTSKDVWNKLCMASASERIIFRKPTLW